MTAPVLVEPVVHRHPSVRSFLRLSRPHQWHKSLMVYAAPAAAGILDQPLAFLRATVTAVAFLLVSIAVYAFNDVRDADDDRRHPRKRYRPVASGALGRTSAWAWGSAMGLIGLATASTLGARTLGIAAFYLLISLLYVFWLKQVAVVEVVVVALGFVVRAVGGGTATAIQLSSWFLAVSLFGALFLVAGKRRAQLAAERSGGPAYPMEWLDQLFTMALLGAALSYGIWAFQYLGPDTHSVPLAFSFVPFLTGLLHYAFLVSTGHGERPETDLLRDPVLVITGLTWAVAVGLGPSTCEPQPGRSSMKRLRVVTATTVLALCVACSNNPGGGSAASSPPASAPTSSSSESTRTVPTSPASSSERPSEPVATESNPPGDIPDNQAFVRYQAPGQPFSVKVPEGWGRTTVSGVTSFTDKLNKIQIEVTNSPSPATVQTAERYVVPRLQSTVPKFALTKVGEVTRAGQPVVLITYDGDSAPDAVTGKVVRDAFEAYLYHRGGRLLTLTLSGPKGADNVDPWRIVSDSVQGS